LPDWLTHVGVAWLACEALRIRRREPILIGAILPDVYKVVVYPLMFLKLINVNMAASLFLEPFHSLLGIGLLSVFVTSFLKKDSFWFILSLLSIGSLIHLLLDSLLPYGPPLLLPVMWKTYGLQIIWQEDYRPALLTVISILTVRLIRTSHNRKMTVSETNKPHNFK